MPQLSLSASVNYTSPLGDVLNSPISAVGSYMASSLGTIDVPSGAGAGASFSIPFGSVNFPIGVVLLNNIGTAANLKVQGGATGQRWQNGALYAVVNPTTPGANPLAAIEVDLVVAQTAPGTITYMLFGD